MLIWSELFFGLALVLVWLAFGLHTARLRAKTTWFLAAGTAFSRTGWLFITLSLLFRTLAQGHLPLTTYYESLVLFIWAALGVYLLLEWKWRWPALAMAFLPLAGLGLGFSLWLPRNIGVLAPQFRSTLVWVHVSVNFIAYGALCLSFLAGVLYLLQEHQLKKKRFTFWYELLPPLDRLDEICHRLITFAFPLLTIGIILGSVWAEYAWGKFWDWNAKETWSLITWLIYACYYYSRYVQGWRGRKAVLFAVIGFAAVLFNYFGVNILLSTPHSYATRP